MMNNFDEMRKLGQSNLDVTAKAFGSFSKTVQTITTEMYAERATEAYKSFGINQRALKPNNSPLWCATYNAFCVSVLD